ncbi:GGDEF domain-containing protein [Paenibacillus rhizophilus]|uniref:GGDEF domain-containing protein n=1 Tax=Paenibacillus rhizophilus TaxID=1850366 RepID=A0A3N9P8W6_9BACL|nr:GGDEF domain-containing protein [Paenibacillus rhizophilus]RQW12713.1 GGDEF domain-containing protein [Paenibacillus rhizophilus]
MNLYWTLIAITLIGQVIYVLVGLKPAPAFTVPEQMGYLIFPCSLFLLLIMIVAEVWLRADFRFQKQVVIGCGFLVSYLLYFLAEPYVDGAQMALMIPVMASLVYFDLRMLYGLGVLNLFLYAGIYFGLERRLLEKPLPEFLMVECIFIVFVVMARGVIGRAYETNEYLEQLTQSEQGLLVERAVSDKLLKIDALTGLYNHKTFHEYLDSLLEQGEKNGLQLQLALFDIDNFKQVNDTYGHWIGDIVLKEVAAKIGGTISLNDFAARYGGEEFAIIFTDKSLEDAYALAEVLRSGIAGMVHPYAGGKPITVSIGLCPYRAGDGKELLFRRTDEALYQAKRSGKNRVTTAGENQLVLV